MQDFIGLDYNTLRMALYALYFGHEGYDNFDSPNYRYIIPLQGNWLNPITQDFSSGDTYIQYCIERNESLTQDDIVYHRPDNETIIAYNRQKCVATILLRFIGKSAEQYVKVMRHLIKRSDVEDVFYSLCNASKLEHTGAILARHINYSGKNPLVCFDIRFKMYYDELLKMDWDILKGVNFNLIGEIK